jgi:hypothetical protein
MGTVRRGYSGTNGDKTGTLDTQKQTINDKAGAIQKIKIQITY